MTKQAVQHRRPDQKVEAAATPALIAELAERIVQAAEPLQVVLFGSFARGRPHYWSDLDFLVIVADGRDRRQARENVNEVLRDSPVPKDVVVTAPAEIARRGDLVGNVLRPALREGRVLYDARLGRVTVPPTRKPKWEVRPVTEDDRLAETRLWLRQARTDLVTAETLLQNPEVDPDPSAYHAQQAAEKALKAVLVFLQIQYPFTHDLDTIRNRIPGGWPVKAEHAHLKRLSDWAYQARYPGDWVPPMRADALDAAREARSIYSGVLRDLVAHGFPEEEPS